MIVLLKKLKSLHPIVEDIGQADSGKWYGILSQHWNQDKQYFGTSTLNVSWWKYSQITEQIDWWL